MHNFNFVQFACSNVSSEMPSGTFVLAVRSAGHVVVDSIRARMVMFRYSGKSVNRTRMLKLHKHVPVASMLRYIVSQPRDDGFVKVFSLSISLWVV